MFNAENTYTIRENESGSFSLTIVDVSGANTHICTMRCFDSVLSWTKPGPRVFTRLKKDGLRMVEVVR